MVAGLGPVAEATPADDVTAIVALLASIAGAEASFSALAKKLCDEVDTAMPAALSALDPPTDGESLYAAADALDIAILSALGSR